MGRVASVSWVFIVYSAVLLYFPGPGGEYRKKVGKWEEKSGQEQEMDEFPYPGSEYRESEDTF